MSKNTKTLIYSVTALLVLVAVVLLLMLTSKAEPPQPPEPPVDLTDEPYDPLLHDSERSASDVVSIKVKTKSDEYEMERSGDSLPESSELSDLSEMSENNNTSILDIPELGGAPRDYTKLNNAARYAAELHAKQVVSQNETNFAQYGLAVNSPNVTRMTVVFDDGETLDIYIGDEAPTSEPMTYIRRAGEDTVYIVWSYYVNQFKQDREFYVSLVITEDYIDAGMPMIERLVVQNVADTYVIERAETPNEVAATASISLYELTEPLEIDLDYGSSENLVYGMFGLTAKEVAYVFREQNAQDENTPYNDSETTGFDAPLAYVEMTADGEVTSLTVGNPIWEIFYDDSGNAAGEILQGYYVAYSETPTVIYIVEQSLVQPFLTVDIEQIMSKMVVMAYIYNVDEFIIETSSHGALEYVLDFTIMGSSTEDETFFLGGEEVNASRFKDLYQFCIGARADALFEGDSVEGMEFLARFTYKYRDGTQDVVEFYDSGDRRMIIVKNDVPMFVGRLMFITRLEQNIEAFLNNQPLIMSW